MKIIYRRPSLVQQSGVEWILLAGPQPRTFLPQHRTADGTRSTNEIEILDIGDVEAGFSSLDGEGFFSSAIAQARGSP